VSCLADRGDVARLALSLVYGGIQGRAHYLVPATAAIASAGLRRRRTGVRASAFGGGLPYGPCPAYDLARRHTL